MKILIVDDEPEAAPRLAGAVAAAGLGEAFAASSAEEAVARVNENDGIDVLVTDVFLEDVDGLTLHESIRAQLPALRTIFLSEYDVSEHAGRIGDCPVLPRPVDPNALVAEIRQLATGAGPTLADPVPAAAGESLAGQNVGAYRIDALLGEDLDGPIYQAVQTTIGRPVEFHLLAPERAADPATVERFLASARAKANVHHSALLSVFEAGEAGGVYFYTSEVRQGSSLGDLANQGVQLEAAVLLQILHTVAEVMVHLGQVHTAHEPLYAGHVILDARQRARLVNLATSEAMGNTARDDMRSLAQALAPVVIPHPSSGALQQLLADMEGAAMTVRSWTALIYEVKRCVGAGAGGGYQLDANGRAEIAAVGAERRRHQRRRKMRLLVIAFLLLAAAAAAWFFLLGGPLPAARP